MAQNYFVLSNFGIRIFMKDYVDSDTVPASAGAADEITSVLSYNLGSFTKENTKFRTLNSSGWESIAPLGNSAEDATFNCIREGIGDPYVGAAGNTTYQRIKDWFMKATQGAGVSSPKCIVECIPRGNGVYEASCYYVIPNNWNPGDRDTEKGQEYSFSVSQFGPQTPLVATYDSSTDTFSFTKASASTVSSVAISGNSTVALGSTLQLTATVSPNTASQSVTWTAESGTGTATVSSEGLVTPVSAGTVTIKATSVADTSKVATKTITITQ